MVEIITEKREWNSVLEYYDHHDYYHTYDYHIISKKTDEDAVLIHYKEGDKTIALPLLLRNIKGTEYRDATSVYGYSGPLTQNIHNVFNNKQFKEQLHCFFLKHNIISAFSRLHPYIPYQSLVLTGIGEISEMGKVVNIDLTKDLETQRYAYNKRLKTYVNKARRAYTIVKATMENDILKFIELYYENMRRVNADSSYFFERNYFFELMNSLDFKTELLLAKCNATKEVVGGAMFIKKNNIVQYHLSGAKEEFLQLNPIKLLIDEVRINATQENFTYFNLGGGIGGREDSLFHFKAGFSKDYRIFNLWKNIINKEVYDYLTLQNLKNIPQELQNDSLSYFPNYRYSV